MKCQVKTEKDEKISSLENSELTGKLHKNVIRYIVNLLV
jgi:hypothetical protein